MASCSVRIMHLSQYRNSGKRDRLQRRVAPAKNIYRDSATINRIGERLSRREPFPRWRVKLDIVVFVLLVGPFLVAIFYPAITGIPAHSFLIEVLKLYIPAFASVAIPVGILLSGYEIYRKYVKLKKKSTEA